MRLDISKKISLTYLVIIASTIISSIFSFYVLLNNQASDKELRYVSLPSFDNLKETRSLMQDIKKLCNSWVYISNKQDKDRLKEILSIEYPQTNKKLNSLAQQWHNEEEQNLLKGINFNNGQIVDNALKITQTLSNESNYSNDSIIDIAININGKLINEVDSTSVQFSKLIGLKEQALEEQQNKKATLFNLLFVIIIVMLLVVFGVSLFSMRFAKLSVGQPLVKIKNIIDNVAKGHVNSIEESKRDDEIGQMEHSINLMIDGLKEKIAFSDDIGKGNYERNFELVSEDDSLGNALIDMRNNLKKSAIEDRQRSWVTSGIAKIGDVLRENNKDLSQLYNNLISFVVKYLEANQGGLFLLNNDNEKDKYLELVACYAYEKRKFKEKRIEIGEGLLGQCFLEKDIIYMTDVPDKYTAITSGLGDATPRCLVLVPLLYNEDITGVLEIASFTPFESYQLEFLKKLAESIASTTTSLKVNERTSKLLEQTQQQTEEMRAQEEEMRQNMEEMQATQEEMQRIVSQNNVQKAELEARMAQVDKTCLVSESDLNGNIIYVNDKFCEVSKYTRKEAIGKPHNIVRHEDMPASVFKELWATIGSGKIFRGEIKNKAKDGTPYWVDAIIAPVLGENGKPTKYIGIRYDITEQKLAEQKLNSQITQMKLKEEELKQSMEELNATQEEMLRIISQSNLQKAELETRMAQVDEACIVSETDLKGNITYVNDKFCKVAKYTREELIGKAHNIVRHPDMPSAAFKQMWATIGSGKIFRAEVKNKAKDGTPYWVDAIVAPVMGENGKPIKYIGIRYDITEQKQTELALKYQLEDLKIKEEEFSQTLLNLQTIQEEFSRKELDYMSEIEKLKKGE